MKTEIDFTHLRASLSIMDLALRAGYELQPREGMKHPVLRHLSYDDKIIITNAKNPANQGYWSPYDDRDKGHLYHFIKNRLHSVFAGEIKGKSTHEQVIGIIEKYAGMPLEPPVLQLRDNLNALFHSNGNFTVPVLDSLQDFKFLTSRGINADVTASPIFKHKILQKRYPFFSNTVFPLFDAAENIIGLDERNTGYKKLSAGSNRSSGIWHSNKPAEIGNVYVFESPIDALSYVQLKMAIKPNALFVSVSGRITDGQCRTIRKILDQRPPVETIKIYGCFDNDKPGEEYQQKLAESFSEKPFRCVREPPMNKDFNEDLQQSITLTNIL